MSKKNLYRIGFLLVVVLGLTLVLSACTAARADRLATPTQTVGDLGSSPQRSPVVADDTAAIEQAMLDSLKARGAPTENARIEVQKIADGYARVHVYYDVVKRPDYWDQGFAYLEDGAWKVWAFGSGIAQEHVEAAGIPRSVWPDGWLAAPTDDTWLLKDRMHGYSLLYPLGYKVEKPSDIETALVVGSLLNAADPRVDIVVEDAGGRTADDLAKQIAADFEGFPIERGSVVLGGVEAIVLDKLPGQEINRRVLLEHDGLLYQLTFWPADESAGDAYQRMEALYETVVASFTFVPRSDERVPGEDCLEAKADTQSLFSERDNLCLLYPVGYEVAQPAENELVFFAGSMQDVTRPKLFIGIEDAAGRTAEQAANERLAVVSCPYGGSQCQRVFGLWVGYEPAEVLDNMPGQEISRHVFVVHDGRLFVLTFVPADPQAGEVYAQMESLYTTVIDSFRFLRSDELAMADPPSDAGTIGGRVWHDLCAIAGGEGRVPASPSAGCVADGSSYRANGLFEAGEPGIEGVLVTLGKGECPSSGLATATTDNKGVYILSDLDAGTYCVTVDSLQEPNASILLPGGWTAPGIEQGNVTVTVSPHARQMDVDFGWDYQFLPAVGSATG